MNSLIFAILWMIASLTGTDPCAHAEFAEANPEQCDEQPATPPRKSAHLIDISNGF